MTSAPVLQHLAASLPDSGSVTPATLLSRSGPLFVTAPDPSPYLAQQAQLSRGPSDGHPLRVLTFNLGLLEKRSFLPFGAQQNPNVPSRRASISERVLKDDWDVLLLQEVWDWSDVTRLAEVAERQGYVWFAGSKRHHKHHGLVILVRGDLITGAQVRSEGRFADQIRGGRWTGEQTGLGYLTWSFTHAPSQRHLRLSTAQLQPHPEHWRIRTLQARQLGLDLAATSPETIVVLGAALYAAPYYPENAFGEDRGEPVSGWWQSALTWPMLQLYGNLLDTRTLGHALGDVQAMHAIPDWNPGWPKRPMNGDCPMLPPHIFTTTDCNSLHFRARGGRDYPARSDHVFFRAPDGAVGVFQTGLAYVQPEVLRSGRHELSDHYGVQVELRIQPSL